MDRRYLTFSTIQIKQHYRPRSYSKFNVSESGKVHFARRQINVWLPQDETLLRRTAETGRTIPLTFQLAVTSPASPPHPLRRQAVDLCANGPTGRGYLGNENRKFRPDAESVVQRRD